MKSYQYVIILFLILVVTCLGEKPSSGFYTVTSIYQITNSDKVDLSWNMSCDFAYMQFGESSPYSSGMQILQEALFQKSFDCHDEGGELNYKYTQFDINRLSQIFNSVQNNNRRIYRIAVDIMYEDYRYDFNNNCINIPTRLDSVNIFSDSTSQVLCVNNQLPVDEINAENISQKLIEKDYNEWPKYKLTVILCIQLNRITIENRIKKAYFNIIGPYELHIKSFNIYGNEDYLVYKSAIISASERNLILRNNGNVNDYLICVNSNIDSVQNYLWSVRNSVSVGDYIKLFQNDLTTNDYLILSGNGCDIEEYYSFNNKCSLSIKYFVSLKNYNVSYEIYSNWCDIIRNPNQYRDIIRHNGRRAEFVEFSSSRFHYTIDNYINAIQNGCHTSREYTRYLRQQSN